MWVLASGLAVAVVVTLLPAWQSAWWLWLGVVTLLALVDGFRLWRLPQVQIQREMETHLPVAAWSTICLRLRWSGQWSGTILVHDWTPGDFVSQGLPLSKALDGAENQCLIRYQIRPRHRGNYSLQRCDVLMPSPWNWWQRRDGLEVVTAVKVFPNYAELGLYLLLAGQQRLTQLGIHQFQRRGQGGDFHQLRDYRTGDSMRQIDWKATARYQRLISREYREDRDQQILFLLDCGRRMRHQGAARGHLDEALDAMLLLSFVALRQGDAVGMMSFAGEPRWFAPRKGPAVLNSLLNTVYDLQAHPVATDYLEAARNVLQRQRRRSLIVLLTNTRDEDYRDLLDAARLLRRRHLVVIADLREALLDQTMTQPVQNLDQALRFYATDDYLAARQHAHQQLGHQGVHLLEVLPEQLSAALVNEYQRLKRSGQLAG
ncbi:MAG: DUF58 domain-containing protein [Wenzhouxiangellaceae bacterium]